MFFVQRPPAYRQATGGGLALVGLKFLIAFGGARLALQVIELFLKFVADVGQARHVLLGMAHAVLGLAPALLVRGDAGGLF